MRFSALGLLILATLYGQADARQQPRVVGTTGYGDTQLRSTMPLMENWRFVQDDRLTDQAALAATGADWKAIRLPHSWNADDAASLRATTYKRGIGWYRLEFERPSGGARHWLEFGAATLVADVWLNGEKLGEHKGGFTVFRFDITDRLAANGRNVLLVRVDNSLPTKEGDVTAIAPLGGDFNVSGGLSRHVALVSTRDPVHVDLADLGGPGVYATTTAITEGNATVNVRSRIKNDASQDGEYVVRTSLLDADNHIAQSAEQPATLNAESIREISQDLKIENVRLWRGIEDPYQYMLVIEVLRDGAPVDKVTHKFGIRQMRFDPNDGFFLNGENLRLRGVAMHQDFLGKAWAVSMEDIDLSLNLVQEIGANAVRLGHYPFSQYALQKASELGLIVWAETALGLGTTVDPCSKSQPTREFVENAKQQLQELIRQQYNHAAVGLWSVGNETSARQNNCDEPYDNVRPVLRELHGLAKQEDPSRATAYAEFGHPVDRHGVFATERITDVFATNRYFAWYTEEFEEFSPLLDGLHTLAYDQPLGISEYGAGAAVTHHSDNPAGGPADIRSAPEGEVSFQPEEYASYVHERNYRVISGKPYLWGSFVWNMFDFGSGHRNEGDVLGVNTKGLVTFDRKTRKDPFFFYKANWSDEPVTYITSRRYTDRSYAVANIKVYSNADSVSLSLNGHPIAALTTPECPQRTCVFKDIRLRQGENTLTAVGDHHGKPVTDSVRWSLSTTDVNIASGWVATGYTASDGSRFGSDNFFLGGTAVKVEDEPGEKIGPESLTAKRTDVQGTRDPLLYKHYRSGTFGYEIPLENGRYDVTLGFLEPDVGTAAGDRVFDVAVNGRPELMKVDVLREAGKPRIAITKSFVVTVSDGRLRLDFIPVAGKAIVSNVSVRTARQARGQEEQSARTPLIARSGGRGNTGPSASEFFDPPPITTQRYEEDYSYLRDPNNQTGAWWEPFKFIPLRADGSTYLEVGDEQRLRFEYYRNNNFGSTPVPDDDYLRYRMMPYAEANLGGRARVIGQLMVAHAARSDLVKNPAVDQTGVDVLQAAAGLRLGEFLLGAGRMVLQYGSGRLINAGPNIRLSYDGGALVWLRERWRVDAFVARPVLSGFDSFDNASNSAQMQWSVYATRNPPEKESGAGFDLFYVGFEDENGAYNQGRGEEDRHTFGTRHFGTNGGWQWDSEGHLQVGTFGTGDIRAGSAATISRFTFVNVAHTPFVEGRLAWISGDGDPNDDRLETFNPINSLGGYFGENGVIGPVNLINLRAIGGLNPSDKWTVSGAAVFYWRASLGDGLYGLGRNLLREDMGSRARFVGAQADASIAWAFNRNLTCNFAYSILAPGQFIEDTGPADTVHFVGSQLQVGF